MKGITVKFSKKIHFLPIWTLLYLFNRRLLTIIIYIPKFPEIRFRQF